jgi:hypothetical protein
MQIYILTEDGYESLRSKVYTENGANGYLDSALRGMWDTDYRRVRYTLKNELPAQEKLHAVFNKDSEESERGKLIYNCFRDLTPLQASSKLLWATLTHYSYRDFCCNKWFRDSDKHADRKKLAERVMNRMFYRAGLNGVQRNAIARYYWGAKKTHELWKSEDIGPTTLKFTDPYYLTEYMLNDSQVWQDTMQRAIGASDYLRFVYLISSQRVLEYLRETTQRNVIRNDHYSKWLSKLFTCWINGSSYRSLSVDEAIGKFTGEAILLLSREQG